MKNVLFSIACLLMLSCNDLIKDFENSKKITETQTLMGTFLGVTISVKPGSHTYYLKQLGEDSLFVHVAAPDHFGNGVWYHGEYLYFTKGSIKSLSWEIPNGKYAPIKKTVLQTK